MADGNKFDIVLFGFRNDVARARTIEFLERLPPLPSGPSRIASHKAMPQRLFAGLESDRADSLRHALEERGAQVAVVLVLSQPAETAARPVQPVTAAPAVSSVRPFTLLLVLLLGISVYFWRESATAPRLPQRSLAQAGSRALAPAVHEPVEMQVFTRTDATDEPAAVQVNNDAIQLAQVGRFHEAQLRLQEALRLAPDQPVLTRNLQTVLLNWGISDLNAGKLDAAVEHLERAAQLGERPEVLRALGVTYFRQADYPQAAGLLERALQKMPNDTNAMLALADVYVQQDKRPQALDLLQRAKEAGASGHDVEGRVQQLSREVDAEWGFVQLESAHFRVSFADDEERSTVSVVLDAMEEAYDTVGAKFDYYPNERTPVVLYTQQDFHAITRTPDWAGAAFDGRIKLPVRGLTRDDPNLGRTARHEYAHSVVARLSGGRCPVWLNEGLAVWAEAADDDERLAWAQRKIAGQQLFTLDALRTSFAQLPAARVEVAYAESYLAVYTLIDRHGARTVPGLLTALGHGRSIDAAFAAVYPGDLAAFEESLLHQLSGTS